MEIKKALDGCALKLMIIHGKTNLIFHARKIPMEAKLYSLRRTVRQQPFVLAVFVTFALNKPLLSKAVLGTQLYAHPYCTNSDILFLFLLTNVLVVSRFG